MQCEKATVLTLASAMLHMILASHHLRMESVRHIDVFQQPSTGKVAE